MIFGYSTNAFVKFTLFESIEKIADLGFKGIEIMGDRPHLYPPDFSAEDLDRLAALLSDREMKITNINSFTLFAVGDTYLPSWIEPDKERRDIRIRHTLDSLRVARTLGCGNISIPPGGPLGKMSRKEALTLFHQGLDQVIPEAEALGVRLLIEPEPDLLMERTSEIEPFVKEIQAEAVGINFDIGHFYCAGEQPEEAMERLMPWIGHMHIEDIAATREHRHLIAGLGAIDFPRVFEAIRGLDYQQDISLELYPYVDTPEAAGKESLEHLVPLMQAAGIDI